MLKQTRLPWILAVALLAACGGDDDGPATTIDAGTPLGEGIVKSVEGNVVATEGLAEGQGRAMLDVFHGDRAVNKKVKVEIAADGARDAVIAKGEGNQDYDLAAGLYFAKITYSEGDLGEPMTGSIAGLKVNAGNTTKYSVVLEAPVGLLQLSYTRSDGPGRPAVKIDEDVQVDVFVSGGDRSTPVWSGKGGESVPLPVGSYDVKTSYDSGKGLPTVEWNEGLEIAAGLARTKREIHLDLDASGVRIDAFNFSSDVNSSTQIYFFNPGADVANARARATGRAGQSIAVDPGEYDVLVVYTPSDDNPDLEGRLKLEKFVVPEREGVRRPVDLQLELGRISFQVKAGTEDLSDRVELVVKRAGADPVASSSVWEGFGGDHLLPAGTYDVYVEFTPSEGDKIKKQYKGIELSNGAVWAQELDGAAPGDWAVVPVQKPAQPLKPIDVSPKAGDDDDSAGDDDDSAAKADDAEEAPSAPE